MEIILCAGRKIQPRIKSFAHSFICFMNQFKNNLAQNKEQNNYKF